MISAIRVTGGIDEGPIYFKEPLSLSGSAQEIFERAADIIFDKMIPRFISEEMVAKAQEGEVTSFIRRKPSESELLPEFDLERIYDYIRMLDGEDYPRAFINFGEYRLELDRAEIGDGKISARVEFVKRNS
ncbi:MAG: hypothetical protein Q4D29_11425 [Lachnospiraceae bacterium]|nr:hypothetical protein [Lachnospiraceae bacterium]